MILASIFGLLVLIIDSKAQGWLFRWKWLVKTRENEDTKKGGEV
jgi:hypothetical protein